MSPAPAPTCFRVTYRDLTQDKTVTLKAASVEDSSLGLGFICLSRFIFDEGGLVVDPAAEDLQRRLDGVKSLHLSIHSILSIEELGPKNKGLKLKGRGNLLMLPGGAPADLPPGPFAKR